MADRKKFEQPGKKAYSVKNIITEKRLQMAIGDMIGIQKKLMETLDDEEYEKAEKTFDTAIASMMAHIMQIDVKGWKVGQGAEAPVMKSGA